MMGGKQVEALSLEPGEVKNLKHHEYSTSSAHVVDKDSWEQVGLMLVTGYNCAYLLSFSNLMMAPLGWTWGVICLAVVGGFAFYSSCLLAGFQVIDGQRFIRYRDIMGFVFGRRMFYITWFLQFLNLILGNMGCILLGGRALKEINAEFSDTPVRLQVFVLVNGVVYFFFAFFVPNMSAMRKWLAVSAVLTSTYIVVLLVVLVKDGRADKEKDYKIRGNDIDRVFNAFGAVAATLVSNSGGLIPEIQSTLRKPVKKNMRRALALQFTVGLAFYYGVTVVGYWAYGSAVSEYLPKDLSGPKWCRILVNTASFLQNIISQHMFVSPVHEALDTNFLRLDESMSSKGNLLRRFLLRALLFGFNILVTAAFPFMGDFINLTGSFSLFPLTLVFPSMLYLKVKGKVSGRGAKAWHWSIVFVFSLVSTVTTAAAVRLIVNNATRYSFFSDT